jgi:hypothetical protein
VKFSAYDFDSQNDIRLRMFILAPADVPPAELRGVILRPLDAAGWAEFLSVMRVEFAGHLGHEMAVEPNPDEFARIQQSLTSSKCAMAFVAPRGVGPTAWHESAETHIRRRFMLLGQTLDAMRVWDMRRAIQALRSIDGFAEKSLRIHAERDMAGIALYAALFEPHIERLDLVGLAKSHRNGPEFINVLRVLDVPQAVALAAENSQVVVRQEDEAGWEYPFAVAEKLGWKNRITIE